MNMADLFNSSAPLALLVLLCVTSVKCNSLSGRSNYLLHPGYLDRADFPLKFTNDGANMVDAQVTRSPFRALWLLRCEESVCI